MPEPEKPPSNSRVRTACLLVLAFVAGGAALAQLRTVLVPFVLALFIAYCLQAVIDAQVRRLHMPRGLALASTAVLGLAVLALLGLLVTISVTEMASDLPTYGKQVSVIIDWATEHLPLDYLGIKRDPGTGSVFAIPKETVTAAFSSVLDQVRAILENGALVVIFLVLLLAGGHRTAAQREDLPAPAPGMGAALMGEIAGHVRRYAVQMILLSAVTGVLVGLTLAVLGVRFALMFGFLAFLLNFIPTIGAIVATFLPVPLLWLSPDLSVTQKVLAVAIPAVTQAVIGNFIQPRLLGRSFGLHPVAILLALIFFGTIWGLVGAFLATPITAVIKIILERIPATRFAGELLAGTYGDGPLPPDISVP